MKILIIGGTGNISSEVARELHERSNKVTLVTRGNRPIPGDYEHIKADRADADGFAKALENHGCDVVIDFVCFEAEDAGQSYEVFKGTVAQYIFISSATVYRKPHDELPITEDSPLGNPFSDYAQKKGECEEYFMSVHGDRFPVTIVRPSHTFGNSWIPSPLNGTDYTVAARIEAGRPIIIHDDGQSLWTLTAASDFAVGLAGLVGNTNALGEAFNITSDQALTWNCIYQEIGFALNAQPKPAYIPSKFLADVYLTARNKLLGDKTEAGVFDNTKIKGIVPDFECVKSFRTAIRESIEWLNADPSRKIVNEKEDRLIDDLIGKWEAAQ